MALTVLSVAYPLAPVRPDAVGGAEQVLQQLDRALTLAGHRSFVIACEGSQVAGTLVPFQTPGCFAPEALRRAEVDVQRLIDRTLVTGSVDLVQIHAIDFGYLLPSAAVPTLVTLHMSPSCYSRQDLGLHSPTLWMNCVSHSQAAAFAELPALAATIENGVAVDTAPPLSMQHRSFAFWLGRICPEKAVHVAIDAATEASVALIIAGKTFPYPEHLRYFQEFVATRLGRACRFVGPVTGACKRTLLRHARCVIVSSQTQESSSLAAREALAAGTPVVARRSPALADLIEDGVTGFLVDSDEHLADAIRACDRLDPRECLRSAREKCDMRRTIAEYFELYHALLRHSRAPARAGLLS